MELTELVTDLALAFRAADATGPREGVFAPGIGPFNEPHALALVSKHLAAAEPRYVGTGPRHRVDMVIPGQWIIEAKLIRPFGDNGRDAEHWSQNLLHPYPGNTSAVGDCYKLLALGPTAERKAVLAFGYEHNPTRVPLETTLRAFELIAREVVFIRLSARCQARFSGLMHPYHQSGIVCAWEVVGPLPGFDTVPLPLATRTSSQTVHRSRSTPLRHHTDQALR